MKRITTFIRPGTHIGTRFEVGPVVDKTFPSYHSNTTVRGFKKGVKPQARELHECLLYLLAFLC